MIAQYIALGLGVVGFILHLFKPSQFPPVNLPVVPVTGGRVVSGKTRAGRGTPAAGDAGALD